MTDEAKALLALSLDSVESIELLLLLRRAPDTFWRSEAASQQLGISRELADKKLAALTSGGLLVRGSETGAYRYAPRHEAIRENVDWLVDAYANRRVAVINAIYSANLEKLRAFSDAFKLKDNS